MNFCTAAACGSATRKGYRPLLPLYKGLKQTEAAFRGPGCVGQGVQGSGDKGMPLQNSAFADDLLSWTGPLESVGCRLEEIIMDVYSVSGSPVQHIAWTGEWFDCNFWISILAFKNNFKNFRTWSKMTFQKALNSLA